MEMETKSYRSKLMARKTEIAKKNEIRLLKIEEKRAEAEKKFEENKKRIEALREEKVKKIELSKNANNPQLSIKAEKFSSSIKQVGDNGFHVEKEDENEDDFTDDNFDDLNDNMGKMPQEMGFDLFGVTINTDTLVNKAVASAQTAVNNYLMPNPPTNTQYVSAPAPVLTQTNVVNQPLDPQVKQMLMIGGGITGVLAMVAIAKMIIK